MTNELLTSAAAERNKEPILTVLESVLPESGSVLEIASGTGQHVCFFAESLPGIRWQPTEPEEASRDAIATRIRETRLQNVAQPIALDVEEPHWPVHEIYDAVLCINMIHISPWRAAEALMSGAERVLGSGGVLFLYGSYKEGGVHTAPTNEAFDASLRTRNPEWGVRDLDDIKALAARHGLEFVERIAMPANNLSVVFRRR